MAEQAVEPVATADEVEVAQVTNTQPVEPEEKVTIPTKDEIVAGVVAALKPELLQQQTSSSVTKEDIKETLDDYKKSLAAAITGETPKKEVDPITKALLTDGTNTMQLLADVLNQQAIERENLKDGRVREDREAALQLASERPDVATIKANTQLFNKLYQLTDETKSSTDRMKEALREYDQILEAGGQGDSAKRISAASSVSSASGQEAAPKEEPKSQESVIQEELNARLERHRKIRNQN